MSKRGTRKTAAALALAAGFAAASFAYAADEQEVEVKLADTPAAVQKAFKDEAKGGAIEKVTKETEDGKEVYEALVTIDGKKYEVEVGADGKLLEKEAAEMDDKEDDDDDDDDDEKEVEVRLSDVPAAAQKTLQEHAKGAKIEKVTKDTEDGKEIYEAEVTLDGKKHEIEVAADGKFIKDEVDDDDDDDVDDDDDKDDAKAKKKE
ncbi:MAG: PepSY domain-containing protein [Tepidisphaeraceae bacterium]